MSFLGEICVCYRLASGVSADGLKFATRTYIKPEFDSKMSKTKFTKLAKWARKKKKYDVVVWYLTISWSR